ncbi:hypothetical protein HKBW3S03_00250 [Candidatus Hakubella thermalkaliphila]|uniref:Uncharacterized protein n=1 Tax=Candidatus Hakubella thermalkaliphila TaxID=2754717 RepID=A0A6V8NES7_9ACTN|nr:hypothetical protein HKBW3S03_00250 [Candidatus Hakubella thermalkaliphila]GFP38621.1 hypothetical protein HKBW3S47_00322 [Candidatus Hakubella thermalkaliphila]
MCLPFSVEYINRDSYIYIFFNSIEHFDPFLRIIFVVPGILKIIDLRFPHASINDYLELSSFLELLFQTLFDPHSDHGLIAETFPAGQAFKIRQGFFVNTH